MNFSAKGDTKCCMLLLNFIIVKFLCKFYVLLLINFRWFLSSFWVGPGELFWIASAYKCLSSENKSVLHGRKYMIYNILNQKHCNNRIEVMVELDWKYHNNHSLTPRETQLVQGKHEEHNLLLHVLIAWIPLVKSTPIHKCWMDLCY